MGLLKNATSLLSKAALHKTDDIKRSIEEQQASFASQRAIEEAALPEVAFLKLIDHDFRTWRGVDLALAPAGSKILYKGQASYFDFNQFEKRLNEGYLTDLAGTELARVTTNYSESSLKTYSLSIDGLPCQTLEDVTKSMISKASEAMRYTFQSLEPMGWIFCRDAKESVLFLGRGQAPRGIWRVGKGENITARIERSDPRNPRSRGMIIRYRKEKDVLPLALVAIALAGIIDRS